MTMSEPALRFRTLFSHLPGRLHGWSARALAPPLIVLPMLAGCARQTAETVAHAPDTPGFWLGVWHGFIFPVAWIMSLFDPGIAIYAVPNTGGWYDFGYFVGIVFLGVGARKTKTVYVGRWGERR